MNMTLAKFVLTLLVAAPMVANGAAAETLRVAGTGGAMAMVERIADAFAASSGIKIEVVPGLGSKGGINAAADGAVDMAISARPLEPAEAARGLTEKPLARTALVFVTSHQKPNGLKSTELTEIFKSKNPRWADGSPMNVILRTQFDGDTILLGKSFKGMAEAIDVARLRPELPVTPTDQDNAILAERLRGSFVQAGLSQIVTEKRDLRFVAIDGVEPTLENFESGKYPYEKYFYIVYSAKTKVAAEQLLAFVRSAKGVGILRETANLPAAE